MERVILKLSGQALSGNGQGLSTSKIHEIALEIKELKNLPTSIGIVCGAGNMWRGRDSQSNHMDRVLADNIGMFIFAATLPAPGISFTTKTLFDIFSYTSHINYSLVFFI